MKLVAVSRLRNEEDIVEAFVRHHAPWLDAHVFLDNGSTDGTLRILHALRAEGFPVLLFQNESGVSVEPVYNTLLYRLAVEQMQADWVLFLDCDEFLTLREPGPTLAERLGGVAPDIACIRLPVFNYVGALAATSGRGNVVERFVRRRANAEMLGKVFVRGGLPQTVVMHGNHAVAVQGAIDEGVPQADLVLAHYPERAAFQMAAKSVLGRLKVIAAGQGAVDAHWGQHHVAHYADLSTDLAGWLAAAEAALAARMTDPDLIDDPLPYRGGALRHTAASDETLRAMSSLIAGLAALARMFGRAHDLNPSVQTDVIQQAAQWRRVF